ncbi:L-threonylcarbamoyladenylate synthase [Thiohalobacter sp.]|uniref:L-threonylcarbamoyladenylate synthase n=1 Tax=Thiohalobacter sp. TaxID=2025948 RepID=UPI00262BC117|nr:Sua5/YciO/YrdC/YwlC family protein [Thiohalobacter sp.]
MPPAAESSAVRPWPLRQARRLLLAGGVIAYPTEAVWGLGCDPFDPVAVARLLALKGRTADKGLILISDRLERVEPLLAPLPAARRKAVLATWPGPHTWLWPAQDWVPDWLTGGRPTLAVRVTAHPLAAALCAVAGRPLVSTSANPSGHRPARSALKCMKYFEGQLDGVLHGRLGGLDRPTTIRDALSGALLRR